MASSSCALDPTENDLMSGSETTGARPSADDVGRPAPAVYRFLNRVMRRLDSRLPSNAKSQVRLQQDSVSWRKVLARRPTG